MVENCRAKGALHNEMGSDAVSKVHARGSVVLRWCLGLWTGCIILALLPRAVPSPGLRGTPASVMDAGKVPLASSNSHHMQTGHINELENIGEWREAVDERDRIITELRLEDQRRKGEIDRLRKDVHLQKPSSPSDPVPLPGVPKRPPRAQFNPPARSSSFSSFASSTTVLVITYARADYLQTTMSHILRLAPPGIKILISQDGHNPSVTKEIEILMSQDSRVSHVVHEQKDGDEKGKFNGYQMLSQHYGFALDASFKDPSTERIIILEEDIRIADDFFGYMEAMAPLLDDEAENLLCVSAWNDNGMRNFVEDSNRLVRSDFFPGLGWMMHRRVYNTLLPWARGYWDDWLREPERRMGRHTIRPEVSRTYHFGKTGGTSGGQYGAYLDSIVLNEVTIDWASKDIGYLKLEEWNKGYRRKVESALAVQPSSAKSQASPVADVRVTYNGLSDFERIARSLGIMDNIKAGIPRTAYKGVVEFRSGGGIVFVSPPVKEIDWS